MLSGETANGEHPLAAVSIMARICVEAESAINFDGLYQAVRNSVLASYGFMDVTESLTSSAVKTALDINAKVIIVLSESGDTCRKVAKFRPPMPIVVLTPYESTVRQSFGVLKNVTAEKVETMLDSVKIIDELLGRMKASGKIVSGDPVVVVQGEHGVSVSGGTSIVRCLTA